MSLIVSHAMKASCQGNNSNVSIQLAVCPCIFICFKKLFDLKNISVIYVVLLDLHSEISLNKVPILFAPNSEKEI